MTGGEGERGGGLWCVCLIPFLLVFATAIRSLQFPAFAQTATFFSLKLYEYTTRACEACLPDGVERSALVWVAKFSSKAVSVLPDAKAASFVLCSLFFLSLFFFGCRGVWAEGEGRSIIRWMV